MTGLCGHHHHHLCVCCVVCLRIGVEPIERRDISDVDGRYGNMTLQQLKLFAHELRQQVTIDTDIIIIIIISLFVQQSIISDNNKPIQLQQS